MTKAIALPPAQADCPMICWTTADRSVVRWSGPAAPTVVHGAGAHATPVVRGLEDTSRAVVVNVVGLAESWPNTVRLVAMLSTSSTWNWMYARVTVAPFGTVTPVKRTPTVWTAEGVVLISRSLLVSVIFPDESRSSASSEEALTAMSSVWLPPPGSTVTTMSSEA